MLHHYLLPLAVLASLTAPAIADEPVPMHAPTHTPLQVCGTPHSDGSAARDGVSARTDGAYPGPRPDGTMNNGLLPNPPTYG
jgi:hypothetical protein